MKQGKQVVLITGASAGMGKEFAKQLLQDGHIVYGAARRLDKMDDLRQAGARTLKMDVTDDASMVQAVEGIVRAEGRIDVLVNNAGFGSALWQDHQYYFYRRKTGIAFRRLVSCQ